MAEHEASVRHQARAPVLISLNEAIQRGIERVRQPNWANPLDHVKLDIIDGKLGPWLHLWAPFNQECNGRDPVDFVSFGAVVGDPDERIHVPYTGPLPDSEEYRAAVATYAGWLAASPPVPPPPTSKPNDR